MSSGIVHARASVMLAAGFVTYGLVTRDWAAVQYATGALIGTLVSPDNDVDAGNLSYAYMAKVGKLPERLWSGIWFMYRRSLKHGGELSHFPVISTLGRIAYLYFFLLVIPYLALTIFIPYNLNTEFAWWVAKIAVYWKVVVGLMAADTIHYILDLATVNDKFNLGSLLSGKTNYNKRRKL